MQWHFNFSYFSYFSFQSAIIGYLQIISSIIYLIYIYIYIYNKMLL